MPLKPLLPSSADSTGVAFRTRKTLTEYDAVALERERQLRAGGTRIEEAVCINMVHALSL
jgi:hypothetical protein